MAGKISDVILTEAWERVTVAMGQRHDWQALMGHQPNGPTWSEVMGLVRGAVMGAKQPSRSVLLARGDDHDE